jgi:hypothetical protein
MSFSKLHHLNEWYSGMGSYLIPVGGMNGGNDLKAMPFTNLYNAISSSGGLQASHERHIVTY